MMKHIIMWHHGVKCTDSPCVLYREIQCLIQCFVLDMMTMFCFVLDLVTTW
jgi:hypothetical protein